MSRNDGGARALTKQSSDVTESARTELRYGIECAVLAALGCTDTSKFESAAKQITDFVLAAPVMASHCAASGVDLEQSAHMTDHTAYDIARALQAQNWARGGTLVLDTDEAEKMVELYAQVQVAKALAAIEKAQLSKAPSTDFVGSLSTSCLDLPSFLPSGGQ